MSKRPNTDQPTTAKRARKASGFRLARSVFTDPVEPTSSSRFVTISENLGKQGLRSHNKILPGFSEPSISQSNGAEPKLSEFDLGLEDAAQHEEVPPDPSHTEQGKKKRKRQTKTYVSGYSNMFLSS